MTVNVSVSNVAGKRTYIITTSRIISGNELSGGTEIAAEHGSGGATVDITSPLLRPPPRWSDRSLDNLVRVHLMPGHRFDTVGFPPLIDGVAFDGLIENTAFERNAIIADLDNVEQRSLFRTPHGASAHARSTPPSIHGGAL